MILEFDGSYDGFLTLVYDCYYQKLRPAEIQPTGSVQLSIIQEAKTIPTCDVKAQKVADAMCKKISPQAHDTAAYAFLSESPRRFMALLQYIKLGFQVGHMVDSHLTTDYVQTVHKLAKEVGGEAHLLTGFCRFKEAENGVYYSPITPKNNVLAILAHHFSMRFISHPWVIHDKRRGLAAIYDTQAYIITPVPADAHFTPAPGEDEIQAMWKGFLKALTIEARRNPALQRQLMPLYFRQHMTEFL